MAEDATTPGQAPASEGSPSPGPQVAPPRQARYCVWFDWAVAAFMGGLALGQLGQEWSSRSDLGFQAVAIPVFLILGEALRRRARWVRVPQLLLSAGITIPFVFALGHLLRHGRAPGGVNAVIAGVLVFAALAVVQLALLLRSSVRRWMVEPRPARIAPWALAALAAPAFGVGLALQGAMATHGWSARSYEEMGIRLSMPGDTGERVMQRQDELGVPFDVHVLLAQGRLCSYTVSYGRLPPAGDGPGPDPAAWRDAVIRRVTVGAEVLSRSAVAGDGRLRVEGEEVRFRQDRLRQTLRVFSPLPRFIVMAKTCYRREPQDADGFFESLRVEPR